LGIDDVSPLDGVGSAGNAAAGAGGAQVGGGTATGGTGGAGDAAGGGGAGGAVAGGGGSAGAGGSAGNAGPPCGDGAWDRASEECDDGNRAAGDGCDDACQVECPGGTKAPADHSCFVLPGGPRSFDEASAACRALGRGFELASVCDVATIDLLKPVFSPTPVQLWLGGRQPEGQPTPLAGWAWVDGTPPGECDPAALWLLNEPTDLADGVEDGDEQCMGFVFDDFFLSPELGTFDIACSTRYAPLCERRAAAVSTPP
jgi:cysteine-rich repeat protein